MKTQQVYYTLDGVSHPTRDAASTHALTKAIGVLRDLLNDANISTPYDTAEKIVREVAMYDWQLLRLRTALSHINDGLTIEPTQ